jgi:hypothetical protein
MRVQKLFLIAVLCLVLGFITTISRAQQAPDEFPPEETGAGADLVVTSVAGPTSAILNRTKTVTYNVQNQGDATSGAYQVGIYLSRNNTINPATDRLLKSVIFSTGLAPGEIKAKTTEVVIPNYHVNGLSGKYYFGVVVANSNMASSKQVSIVRYTRDDNDTVTDHKTDLIWQRANDGRFRQWADAKQYCEDLVLGGKADWRMPSIEELVTIIDYSQQPSIDPVFNDRKPEVWSCSKYVMRLEHVWTVDFYDGRVEEKGATHFYNRPVRCVRSGP